LLAFVARLIARCLDLAEDGCTIGNRFRRCRSFDWPTGSLKRILDILEVHFTHLWVLINPAIFLLNRTCPEQIVCPNLETLVVLVLADRHVFSEIILLVSSVRWASEGHTRSLTQVGPFETTLCLVETAHRVLHAKSFLQHNVAVCVVADVAWHHSYCVVLGSLSFLLFLFHKLPVPSMLRYLFPLLVNRGASLRFTRSFYRQVVHLRVRDLRLQEGEVRHIEVKTSWAKLASLGAHRFLFLKYFAFGKHLEGLGAWRTRLDRGVHAWSRLFTMRLRMRQHIMVDDGSFRVINLRRRCNNITSFDRLLLLLLFLQQRDCQRRI